MEAKWKASFTGRKLNSDGIFYPIETVAIGKTEEEARLYLYENYEHISFLVLKRIESA